MTHEATARTCIRQSRGVLGASIGSLLGVSQLRVCERSEEGASFDLREQYEEGSSCDVRVAVSNKK